MGKGRQRWVRSGWVRLIERGWAICLVGGCGYTCRSRGRCDWLWASLGKGGQVWMGQTDWVGIEDMSSGWVWVCVQV